MTLTGISPAWSMNLDSGTYYVGYSKNINNVELDFMLRRIVNTNYNINGTLVADPAEEQGYTLGSEVNFNNGLCNNYTITEGFTRCIYLKVDNILLEPISRLEYDWYSSNDLIATVTDYGTVLAQHVTEDTSVTIYAVLKNDPSVVYAKTFTILNETKTNIIEIECSMSYSYSEDNGEYVLQLNNYNSPYPMVSQYFWQVTSPIDENSPTITFDGWGRITSSGIGTVELTGTYLLNQRVHVIVQLTIY